MIARKQAKSEGADGFPVAWQWLADLGVKPGEFQVETKARLALAMRSREWPEKQRVWACLSLATMGFNQELAVRMERGRVVPLTQSDIASQTGIDVHNVHRCVLDLESEGWLKRTAVDEARGLRKGEVQIHCYAIPRPPKKSRAVAEEAAAAGSEYDGLPDEMAYWLRHLKFHAPGPEKVEQVRMWCLEMTERRDWIRDSCRREPDQMPLPGISANSVKVARLAKSKGGEVPRAIDSGSARTGQNEAVGLRAGRNGVGARPNSARINRSEIKEIKNTEGEAGRQALSDTGVACLPALPILRSIEHEILKTGICGKLNVTPDRALLERIAQKLNGNSPQALGVRIHLRFDDIKSLGILEHLAADVAASEGAPVGEPAAPRETADLRRRREVVAGLEFMQKMRDRNE